MENKEIIKELSRCIEENIPTALATVVKSSGSTPAQAGAKMLVYEDGKSQGTVGGGSLEMQVIKDAVDAINNSCAGFFKYDLTGKDAAELGMVCGGKVTVFIEPYLEPPHMLIIGAGHISLYLARLAKMMEFKVTVLDDREEFANRERFPDANRILVQDIEEGLAGFSIAGNTYIVIVTRGHSHDEAALEKVVDSDARYIGMIGSKVKTRKVFENLVNKGVSKELMQRVYAPIGLNLGGNSPEEIALSIMAQVLRVKNMGPVKMEGNMDVF